ncbi:transposase family protein [Streptomyces sp. NPDC001709]
MERFADLLLADRRDAAGCGLPGLCPDCAQPVTRVHSRYWPQVTDLPVVSQRVVIPLRVRRFPREQARCRRRTFVEQVRGLTEPFRRATTSLRSAMRAIAMELGGRPGQRLCRQLLLHGGRAELLRLLKAASAPEHDVHQGRPSGHSARPRSGGIAGPHWRT